MRSTQTSMSSSFPLPSSPYPPFNLTTLKNPVIMKIISYVIDPDGDIELILREPNSHQISPGIHFDDSIYYHLPDSNFDNPPTTGRYTILNELYTKPTTATGTQTVEVDHGPRELMICSTLIDQKLFILQTV
ncbi:hypothetical protein H9Q70_009848 [Fusarium xylarioides]|nr:hypothetical protein H9Q70_009848 [Fusarium xylarioides]